MLPFVLLLFGFGIIVDGCFTAVDDVLARAPESWSTRDCITVILASTANNYRDPERPYVKVAATMFSPSAVLASYRRADILGRHRRGDVKLETLVPFEPVENTPDSEYVSSVDILTQEYLGLYRDWQKGQYVDAHGNYLKSSTQIDSLTFFISLENTDWPCLLHLFFHGASSVYPCYIPDISDLDSRIYLVNDENKFIRPIIVWGRHQEELMMPENIVVKFQIGKEDYSFLAHSKHVHLLITGFDSKISLEYPIALLR